MWKEELKRELRPFVRDRAVWVWWVMGMGVAATVWVWGQFLPGLAGQLAWAATVGVWIFAAYGYFERRAQNRADRAVDLMLSVDVPVWVQLDTATNALLADREPKATWYRVSVRGQEIGRIEHVPDSAADRRWMARKVGSSSSTGYRTKRAACEALVRHSIH
jgi:hypothetical protein